MNTIKNTLLAGAITIASCATSMATISVILQADLLEDNLGAPIPANSLVMLLVDTTGNGFSAFVPGSSTLVSNSPFTAGGDDYVVYRNDLTSYGPGVLDRTLSGASALNLASIPGWNTGDPLALVWFVGGPTGMTLGNTTITNGSRYGIYSNPLAVDGSRAWVTPTDPTSTANLLFYTKDSSGGDLGPGPTASNLGSAGRASQTVVPEPSTLGMLALGVIGLMSRRRRN